MILINSKKRLSWCCIGSAVSIVLLAVGAYFFLIRGDTAPHPDGRTAIQLSAADRDLVLSEMRQFLASVEGISRALTQEDMQAVAQQARAVGNAAAQQVPASLMAALPLGFKTMGRGVHQAFDQIALDAESLGDAQHSLQQLSATLSSCVACHSTYRFHTP